MPVRGRHVALAALFAVVLGTLLVTVEADAAQADNGTGGVSATPPPAPVPAAPVARAALAAPGARIAVAPLGAPPQVIAAIAAANRITRKPYKWGGGHGRWSDTGYDCSGTVSYVLHAAGLLDAARDSSGFMRFGVRGKGSWITIYTNPGHAYMVIAGLRFDTSGRGESGPRWRLEPRSGTGYVKRHLVGL
jgi:hypothetical protein